MQHQQEFDHTSNTPEETPAPLGERQSNTDPREQPPSQAYTYRSYEEGYTDLSERDFWPHAPLKLRAGSGGIRIYRLQYPQIGS